MKKIINLNIMFIFGFAIMVLLNSNIVNKNAKQSLSSEIQKNDTIEDNNNNSNSDVPDLQIDDQTQQDIDDMIENGATDYKIQQVKEMFAKRGYNVDDWVVAF